MTTRDAIDRWIATTAIELDPDTLQVASGSARFAALESAMVRARVVMLGETNHFVHEKVEFRLWWLRRLAARRRIVVGEELSWFDAQGVARYLDDGDEGHFERLWTFGYRGNQGDRDDSTTGILAASEKAYPTERFKAEQQRFYRALRALPRSGSSALPRCAGDALPGVAGFFGFDIGGHDAGYHMFGQETGRNLRRVRGESLEEEVGRLERARTTIAVAERPDLEAMIDSLKYTAAANRANSYEALRPAMAFREQSMKRRLEHKLATLGEDEQLVLMGHAFHLAKDDAGIRGVGVGPGGDQVPSLGHHLTQVLGLSPFVVWWLYGAGEDSQPFPDLPKQAKFPASSLNARLARSGVPLVLAATDLVGEVGVGHMYNQVAPVKLAAEADAVFFLPRVSPLR